MYVHTDRMKVVKCISIGLSEAQFLENHNEINLSELVRKMLERLMNKEAKET